MLANTATLTVNPGAIAANYHLLREQARGKEVAAVVKADAYGLGAAKVVPALAAAGCRFFYVAHLQEALALRPLLAEECAIAVLHGFAPEEHAAIAGKNIIPVINHLDALRRWHNHAHGRTQRLPVIVHLDTGLNRLGLPQDEVARLLENTEWLDGLEVRYWMSHLACADEPQHPMNAQQLNAFGQFLIKLPTAPLSFANSSGIFLGASYHFDQVRPGAALYGINPTPQQPNVMQPVVALDAPIIQLRALEKRSAVGYGATWRSKRLGKAAILPVGYADGFPRSLGNRGMAHVAGHPAPVIGRISMDLLAIDVSEVPEELCRVGAMAALIGKEQGVDAVAAAAGTIGYEILTQLGSRYQRVYTQPTEVGDNDRSDQSSCAAGARFS